MDKPLKWLQGRAGCDQRHPDVHVKAGCAEKTKERIKAGLHAAAFGWKLVKCESVQLKNSHPAAEFTHPPFFFLCPPFNVDASCDVLLVSALCSRCSSAALRAQTRLPLPPLNSLLSERGQRSGTVTYPRGG